MKKFIVEQGGNELHMLCPICGQLYTHLYKVEQYLEKDNRLCNKMYFWCEAEHRFTIDFHQHEGITYLETKEVE